jgi:hypothetical protein
MSAGFCLLLFLCTSAFAQMLQISPELVTRNNTLKGALQLSSSLSGQGQLTLTWTDSYGRTVAVQSHKPVLPSPTVGDPTVSHTHSIV